MPRFCTTCGAELPDAATFCVSCGKPIASNATTATSTAAAPAPAAAQQPAAAPISDNLAGVLAYVTIIPAIVFLVLEPYNKNRFVRFHSFQCIAFNVAWIALWVVLNVVAMIPFLGFMTMLVWPLVGLGGFVLWLVLVLKAYQGQIFKLPVIGDWAEKQASSIVPPVDTHAKAA